MSGLGPGAVWTALLDACVLVPAPLRDTLLRFAEAEMYRPKWSAEILGEVERTLVGKLKVHPAKAQQTVTTIDAAFDDARVTGYETLTSRMRNQRKDRHVLAAAVVGRADVIVTANTRHFPASAVAAFRIELQTPDEFLLYTFDLDPDLGVQLLRMQAADTGRHGHPAYTVAHVLDALEVAGAPRFAARLRQQF